MDIRERIEKAKAAQPPMPMPPAKVVGRCLHIDGDYAAYFCSGKDDTPAAVAKEVLSERIASALTWSGAASYVIHLTHKYSDKGRRAVIAQLRPYQGQRNASRKPENWQVLRDYMEGGFAGPYEVWRDREADDGMTTRAYTETLEGRSPVIYTRDKDLRMSVGAHLNWMNHKLPLVFVGENDYEVIGPTGEQFGPAWFWTQMLIGDQADHIQGVPKIGPAKAAVILEGVTSNEEAASRVLAAYRRHFGDDAYDAFVETSCLLWMRRGTNAGLLDWEESVGLFDDDVMRASTRLLDRVHQCGS